MKEGPFAGPADRARFEREVQILAHLQHPNIVAVHDSGVAAGCFYSVMDYISGQPLDAFMENGRLSIRETLILFRKICNAVNAAHLRGIIHRDLKPSNIRIDPAGEPHVLDFGLAKVSPFDPIAGGGSPVMTVTGQFVGSLPWASPEQAEGRPSRIDVRTDVYSLGVVLYQMLTAMFPYDVVGSMRDVLDRILHAEPVRPRTLRRQVDDEVETIVLKCLAKEPERRYQTAGDLDRDLQRYLQGEPIEAKRDSTWYVLRKQMRRHRLPLAVALGFMVLVMASSVVAWWLYARSQASLWESYLAQARAQRYSGRPGRRVEALAAIEKAAAIRRSDELRNEAIACLALTDVKILRSWAPSTKPDRTLCAFDPALTRYAFYAGSETALSVQRAGDGAELFRLPRSVDRDSRIEPSFSSDGRRVAFGVKDRVEIWDIVEKRPVDQIPIAATPFQAPLRFSPDDRALAIGTPDGTVVRYEPESRRLLRFEPVHAPVELIVFSPDGRRLATASTGSTEVVIRDAASGDVERTLEHPDNLWSLAWSPDGRLLAAGCADYRIYVWGAESGRRIFTLAEHTNVPARLAFDGSSSLLLSAGWEAVARLWNLSTGEQELALPLSVWTFRRGGKEFAFDTGGTASFGLAEVLHGDVYRELPATLSDGSRVFCQSVCVSRDGRLAATTTSAGWSLWDLKSERQIALLPGAETLDDVLFAPNGAAVLTASAAGVELWKLEIQGEAISAGPPRVLIPGYGGEIRDSVVTGDGRRIAGVGGDGFVYVRDLEDGAEVRRIGPHTNASSLAASPDGLQVATGTHNARNVMVWDVSTGDLVTLLPLPRAASVAYSPDGRWLATSEAEHVLWNTRTWRAEARLHRRGYLGSPSCMAFSPDSACIAVLAEPGIIQLIETRTFTVVAELERPHAISGSHFAFGRDGATLVVGDTTTGAVLIWDLRALRRKLAELDLDWDLPPYPPAPSIASAAGAQVEIAQRGSETEGP